MATRSHAEKVLILTLGQVAGLGVGFLIPVFLSRWLTLESYGTYKQLMLIQTLLLLTVHFGMDWGLFFFIRQTPRRAWVFSQNAVLADSAFAVVVLALGCSFSSPFAALWNNPALADYLPAFAVFMLFTIPSHHFNHYLVVLDLVPAAASVTLVYEFLKTVITLAAFFYFRSLHAVLWGLAGLSCIRTAILFSFNRAQSRKSPLPWPGRWTELKAQARYGFPLGLNNLVAVFLKLDRFVISSQFGVKSFALYSVGCFELPVVESASITLADLMSIDMVTARAEGRWDRVQELWRGTIRRIALYHVPLTVFSIGFAPEIIRLIYSDRYAESANYFRIFSLIFLLANLIPEVVFRVFGKTRYPLFIQLIGLSYGIPLVVGAAKFGGALAVLGAKLLADGITALIRLGVARKLLRLEFRHLLPFSDFFLIAFNSILPALVIRWVFGPLPHGPLALGAAFGGFVAIHLGLAIQTGQIRRTEIAALWARVREILKLRPAATIGG